MWKIRSFIRTACLAAFTVSTLGAGIAEAQQSSCVRPVAALSDPCGAPGQDVFTCVPTTEELPYTTIYGGGATGTVDYFLPNGCPASAQGFPVVWLFHGGSGLGDLYEGKDPTQPSGLKNRRGHGARTIKALLQAGYAVVVPHASSGQNWQSDWPDVLAGLPYTWTTDYRFLNKLMGRIENPSQA